MTDHRKIHLVGPNEPKATDPQHPNTRLSLGEYFADVINSRQQGCAYWIIQRIGSSDVIDWGRAPDFDSAQKTSHDRLEQLVHGDMQRKRG